MTLDRKQRPAKRAIRKVRVIKAKKDTLRNGIPFYQLNARGEALTRMDIIFPAGIWYQSKPFLATTTSKLLSEGTASYSSLKIAELFDYYGAHLQSKVERDHAIVSIYSPNRHLKKILPVVFSVLTEPEFSEKEFKTYIGKKRQQVMIEAGKVKTIARNEFDKALFGSEHPYGKAAEVEDLDNLTPAEVNAFFKTYYNFDDAIIVLAGNIGKSVINPLNDVLGAIKLSGNSAPVAREVKIQQGNNRKILVEKDDAVQSALRIGRVLFNKTHEDYFGMQVLNTVLGGYFGSRLMANIREDKGYTYGIGSAVVSMKNEGYFTIVSEVGADVCGKAISEIYKEIGKLQTKRIPGAELSRVKNYMLGEVIRQFDGPFSQSDSFWSILEYGLDYTYYDRLVDAIRNTKADQLLELANKYLERDSLYEVVAGKY